MIAELLNMQVSSFTAGVITIAIIIFGILGLFNLLAIYYNMDFFEFMDKLTGCEGKND